MGARAEQVAQGVVEVVIHLVVTVKDLFMVTTFTLYHKVGLVGRTMLMLQ
jgi:hypothetical protein